MALLAQVYLWESLCVKDVLVIFRALYITRAITILPF
jgi:hypothetical protein